ncbi:MAG: multifunctional CCA addition/repair protein [Moraxellaceae bacterium]|nr:MAG: multifunctional CCA addition/repair protein [Moraxellaceae bacterium]
MNVFLVGGAVRDRLLGRPIVDRDWVVVGGSPKEMLAQKYQQVGNDFPVFLHPSTGEEYALARTERKIGAGYEGFECYSGTDVSLEDDLSRRDLTINAMAESDSGDIIDPFNGQQDLNNKILRHVSDAFVEDPLRVLRVARFLARYGSLGFTIASETLDLMSEISNSGELESLTIERVWVETEKALLEPNPRLYFEALRNCGALAVLFPDIDTLFGIPQPEKHHPEIDTGLHTLMVLDQATSASQAMDKSAQLAIRFAALTHDLGKGKTPEEMLPSHHGHEQISEFLTQALCKQYRVPNQVARIAKLVARYHTQCHTVFELKPSTVMRLLEALDVLRRPETLPLFLAACTADARGRTGLEDRAYPQAEYLEDAAQIIKKIDPKSLIDLGFRGEALGNELRQRRIKQLKELKNNYTKPSN